MSLNDTLMQDMKTAMKAKDKEALTTIRSLKAAVMNYKIKVGHDLTSDDELTVLSSALKQRKESLEEFTKAGRDDLTRGIDRSALCGGIKSRHNVALLHLVRIGLCPHIILARGIIGGINFCTRVFQFFRKCRAVTITNRIRSPAVQNFFFTH